MLRSYLISAWRNLLKDRVYTIINTVGLAIGLATCFLIYTWIASEISFDRNFPDANRIFRVFTSWDKSPEEGYASTYPMIRTRVLSQFPEIESSVRIFDAGFLGGKTRVTCQGNVFTDNKLYYVDSTFFEVFPFRFLQGNSALVFRRPNEVVLTQATAKKYFGDTDPIGKVITHKGG